VRLRFFFDPGSGVSFWTADAEAHARFADYPVETEKLALPEGLAARGEALIVRYDGSIDWDDPGGPGGWTLEDYNRFAVDARAYLAEVAAHHPDITFEDCLRAPAAT
jgi:hypothetical protein